MFYANRHEFYKYELLTLQDGFYKHQRYVDDYVETGKIDVDFSRDIISNLSMELSDEAEINYFADIIRPWYCLISQGITYEYALGTYMFSIPNKSSDGVLVNRSITGFDMLLALDQDKLDASMTISSGAVVTDEIESLLDTVGSWVQYKIEPSSSVLNKDMVFVIGDTKLSVINQLLEAINYNPLFCTGKGVYRAIPWSNVPNITWTFEDNFQSLYESGVDVETDYSEVYNKVIMVADSLEEDAEAITSIKTMEDFGLDTHPLSFTSIGRYIEETFKVEATSQANLDAMAEKEIYNMLQVEESIKYKHAFVSSRPDNGLPWYGDCYKFKNALLGADSVYKIDKMSMDLIVGSSVNSIIKQFKYI